MRRFVQLIDRRPKRFFIQRNGFCDIDRTICRFLQAFFRHKPFFKELFPRAQARAFNLNVHVGFISRQFDQVVGKIIDFYRFAHIQNENLTALGIRACLQYERYRLGNGHEIADYILVRNRNRTAFFNLLFKQRNYRAVRTEYVAKTYRYKVGIFAVFSNGLNNHLANALGRAHDIGGVDSLIRRDLHERFHVEFFRSSCKIERTEHVVFHCFVRARFHQRHVLVRSGVKDDLRTIFLEYVAHFRLIANTRNQRQQIEIGTMAFEFLFDLVRVVFVNIQNDQLRRIVRSDLTAKFATDRAAATRNKYYFPFDIPHNFV